MAKVFGKWLVIVKNIETGKSGMVASGKTKKDMSSVLDDLFERTEDNKWISKDNKYHYHIEKNTVEY